MEHLTALDADAVAASLQMVERAATQNNLGVALQRLGERESGVARLEEAVTAYPQALEERTRASGPLAWAMTQNNLGIALQGLGNRESAARVGDEFRKSRHRLDAPRRAARRFSHG